MRRLLAAALLLGATMVACFEEIEGILFLVLDGEPPAVTSDPTVDVSGTVTRSPVRQEPVIVVTVTGGAATVVDTASGFGLFDLTIPLRLDAQNDLTFTASDNTGATTTAPVRRTVVHESPPLRQPTP